MSDPPTSEPSPSVIAAVQAFGTERNLETLIVEHEEEVPDRVRHVWDGEFGWYERHASSYLAPHRPCLPDGELLPVGAKTMASLVMLGDELMGFCFVLRYPGTPHPLRFLNIFVDDQFRRRAGWSRPVERPGVGGTVGVAHVAVLEVLSKFPEESCWTDATTDESRSVFASLGFTRTAEHNPCNLELLRGGRGGV